MADTHIESESSDNPHKDPDANPKLTFLHNQHLDNTLVREENQSSMQRVSASAAKSYGEHYDHSREFTDLSRKFLLHTHHVDSLQPSFHGVEDGLVSETQAFPHPAFISGDNGGPSSSRRDYSVPTESDIRRGLEPINFPFIPALADAPGVTPSDSPASVADLSFLAGEMSSPVLADSINNGHISSETSEADVVDPFVEISPVVATLDSTTAVTDLFFSSDGIPSPAIDDSTNDEHTSQGLSKLDAAPASGEHSPVIALVPNDVASHDFASQLSPTLDITPDYSPNTSPSPARNSLTTLPFNTSSGSTLAVHSPELSTSLASTVSYASHKSSCDTLASTSSVATRRVHRKPLSPDSQRLSREAGEYLPMTATSMGFDVNPLPPMGMPAASTHVAHSDVEAPPTTVREPLAQGALAWVRRGLTGLGRSSHTGRK